MKDSSGNKFAKMEDWFDDHITHLVMLFGGSYIILLILIGLGVRI